MASTSRRAGFPILAVSVLILLAAFALRVYDLGAQSFWFDEGWSWHLARLPLADMAATTAGDRSPALYYGLLAIWMRLAGESEMALRYGSVLADVATVALLIALMRRLRRAAAPPGPGDMLPALLYLVSPYAVWYAQETRMYALVAALCLGSSYCLLRWLAARSPAAHGGLWLAGWAVCFGAAIHSHYYAIFLLPAHGLIVLGLAVGDWRRAAGRRAWRTLGQWLIALAAVLATFVPWLILSRSGFAHDDGFVFPLNTVAGRAADWLRAFTNGGLALRVEDWQVLLMGLAMLLGAAGYLQARRVRELLIVLALAFVPLLAATAAVWLFFPFRSVFHPRYLIFIGPAVCLLIGGVWGTTRTARAGAAARVAIVCGLWLPALWAMRSDPAVARDDVRAATRHVVEALEPRDAVIMSRDNYAVRYYWRDAGDALTAIPEGLQGVLRSDRGVIDFLNARQPGRVRLMLWQDDVVDPQKLIESTLWARGYQIGEYNFRQIRLPLYQMTRDTGDGVSFTQTDAVFDAKLALRGYWMSPEARPGNWFYTVLNWEPSAPLQDYKVFVHGLDAQGNVRFQQDKQALNELVPTSVWQPGARLRDAYAVVLPKDLPPGEYQIVVGLYPPAAPEAPLPAAEGGVPAPGNAVRLGTLRVK